MNKEDWLKLADLIRDAMMKMDVSTSRACDIYLSLRCAILDIEAHCSQVANDGYDDLRLKLENEAWRNSQ